LVHTDWPTAFHAPVPNFLLLIFEHDPHHALPCNDWSIISPPLSPFNPFLHHRLSLWDRILCLCFLLLFALLDLGSFLLVLLQSEDHESVSEIRDYPMLLREEQWDHWELD
jgi:hypothetical protein